MLNSLKNLTKKGIVQNSIYYIILGFLPMGINFFLAPIYAKFFPSLEYGLISVGNLFGDILSILITFGLDGAFSRFYFDADKEKTKVGNILFTVISCFLVTGTVSFILLYFFGDNLIHLIFKDKIFNFNQYGIWVFISVFCSIIQGLFLSFYRNSEKIFLFGVTSTLFFLLRIISFLYVIFILNQYKADVFLYYRSISDIISLIIMSIAILSNINYDTKFFEYKLLKKMIKFSLPLVFYLLFLALYQNYDKWIVERYFDLINLGQYSFAFTIASLSSVLLTSTFNALSPKIYKYLSQDKIEFKKIKFLCKNYIYILIIIIFICLALIIPVLNLFISIEYYSIIKYIGILFITYIPQIFYIIYSISLYYNKDTKIMPLISFTSLIIGLLFFFILRPYFGILAVCYSLLIAKLYQMIFTFYTLKIRNYNINYLPFLSKFKLVWVLLISYSVSVYFIYIEYIWLLNIIPIILITFYIILNYQKIKKELNYSFRLFNDNKI